MSWFPDLGRECMIATGDHVRAIGWLHPDHPHPHGPVPAECLAKLKEFARLAGHCPEALYIGICMGFHTCEFCEKTHGHRNFGVPAGELLYMAPEMVAHYVEQHRYCPPAEFLAAVMASPLPGTPEYMAVASGFRQIHQQQLEKMA